MSAFPYMRTFVGDYLGDTRHLTTLEHGAYLLLIFAYWQRGEALPADETKLAQIAGLTRTRWASVREHVLEFFEQKNGKLFHNRIEKEIDYMLAKSLKSKRAGQASVQRRLNKRSTKPDAIVHSPEDTSAKADDAREDARELGLPLVEPPSGGNAIGEKFTAAFEHWWSIYPNKVGKGKAADAYQAAFKRLGGQKAGTERVHAHLFRALTAQVAVWKRKRVVGKFVPHPTTWLNQSRWEDADVVELLQDRPKPVDIKVNGDTFLAPATPPPERKATFARARPVGWTPDDEQDG